ncbi:MAG TPA: zf-TFIIB domain-containing protein [Planctomycetaceae bacterium]
MKCPVCNVELRMTERQGIEVDYCPQCRGVWLDRGELDKIIERSTASRDDDRDYDASYPPEHRSPTGQHGGYPGHPSHKHYKKKSIWREIFDFD